MCARMKESSRRVVAANHGAGQVVFCSRQPGWHGAQPASSLPGRGPQLHFDASSVEVCPHHASVRMHTSTRTGIEHRSLRQLSSEIRQRHHSADHKHSVTDHTLCACELLAPPSPSHRRLLFSLRRTAEYVTDIYAQLWAHNLEVAVVEIRHQTVRHP